MANPSLWIHEVQRRPVFGEDMPDGWLYVMQINNHGCAARCASTVEVLARVVRQRTGRKLRVRMVRMLGT